MRQEIPPAGFHFIFSGGTVCVIGRKYLVFYWLVLCVAW